MTSIEYAELMIVAELPEHRDVLTVLFEHGSRGPARPGLGHAARSERQCFTGWFRAIAAVALEFLAGARRRPAPEQAAPEPGRHGQSRGRTVLHPVLDQASGGRRCDIDAAAQAALKIEVAPVRNLERVFCARPDFVQCIGQRHGQRSTRPDAGLPGVCRIEKCTCVEAKLEAATPVDARSPPDVLQEFELVARVEPAEDPVANEKAPRPFDMTGGRDDVIVIRRGIDRDHCPTIDGHADGRRAIEYRVLAR